MAQTVHAALIDILGEAQLVGLREAGRYRRDVY
jgi:sulfite reductase (NADPH) flavoprotein alpha-component